MWGELREARAKSTNGKGLYLDKKLRSKLLLSLDNSVSLDKLLNCSGLLFPNGRMRTATLILENCPTTHTCV